jgi:hypothetical protein
VPGYWLSFPLAVRWHQAASAQRRADGPFGDPDLLGHLPVRQTLIDQLLRFGKLGVLELVRSARPGALRLETFDPVLLVALAVVEDTGPVPAQYPRDPHGLGEVEVLVCEQSRRQPYTPLVILATAIDRTRGVVDRQMAFGGTDGGVRAEDLGIRGEQCDAMLEGHGRPHE